MLDSPLTTGVAPSCPTLLIDSGSRFTAAVLALPETPPALWPKAELNADNAVERVRNFLHEAALPAPELTLVCGMTPPAAEKRPGEDLRAERIRRWKDTLHRTEGRPETFLRSELPGWEVAPLLAEAQRAFGAVLATDSGMAAVLAALSTPLLRERCWQEGVTVLWAGYRHVQAFMIYRERLLGLYEQHSDIPRNSLLNDLRDMRLNWLPDEQVRAAGGHGCICGDLPAEAEGFRPTWILGPRRDGLKGCGRLLSPCGDDRFDRCFGLLFGMSLRTSA